MLDNVLRYISCSDFPKSDSLSNLEVCKINESDITVAV